MLNEAQKIQRKKGIGGTDIAAILGFSQYKTPLDVYEEKLGIAPEQQENKFMRVGQMMEKGLIDLYEKDMNCQIVSCDTLYHSKYPFLLANIDGKVSNTNILLECKTAFKTKSWGNPGSDHIPEPYLFQVAHYANITNADKVDIAVLFIESRDFAIYTYHRNADLERAIESRAITFWNDYVLKHTPPPPINAKDCKRFYTLIKSEAIVANNDIENTIAHYKEIKNKIKKLKEQENILKNKLVVYMEGNERLLDENGTILATYRNRQGASYFNTKRLQDSHPELFKQYQDRRENIRVFCVK